MPTTTLRAVLGATALSLAASGTHAALETVVWAADGTNNGAGSGTLGGSTTVTYTSAPGFNSGTTLAAQTWAAYTGTDGATGGSVTSQTAGVLGGSSTGSTQTISFSAAVANPILLVSFLDQSDVFNFGANAFSLLDSNNATVSSPLIIGSGSAADTPNDGFAIRFAGTFGPGTPLVFMFSSNGAGADGLQTVGFTIGTPLAPTAVPEPGSIALLLCGLAGWGAAAARRRTAPSHR